MDKKKDKAENKKLYNYTMIMIWVIMGIIAAAVLCCVVGFFFPIFKYNNTNNIVITFLGALAAFVVISNYAQMVEIRNETKAKLDEIEDKEKKFRGLDIYYDNSIKKDIVKVLKNYGVNGAFSIDKNTMRIKYLGDLVFLVRITVPERTEEGVRNLDKTEYWYYTVNLLNGKALDSSKEEFNEYKA